MTDQIKADLDLFSSFEAMFRRRLAEIPEQTLSDASSEKTENVAEKHFSQLGYKVFRSRARNGYRAIVDAPANWPKLALVDREMYNLIKRSIPLDEFICLLKAVRIKNGTPDLLLLKDGKISFVEVKAKDEEVKPCSIQFYLLYNHCWPISILRVTSSRSYTHCYRTADALEGEFS